ncbi:hypothetical protein EML15_04455 [Corynebacterium sp. sy017]|uniref:hypothetical protein n=1 Tax=unclassified Corynebacterium TaxID=2624378 RepID=UPI001186EC6A|nr:MULTISPECIES: hypothetical protein [unclassified Corynebacterium]MBP3088397.1 hypothetical protein [Corynebacterium sp. sy017]QDZ41839.1 hypothetical protein FQV43_00645 [Corynebacterium sp. sy039]TSD91711.1 hypothetical protein ELY17_04455 [Corynebacterium sp. SY003]
MSITFGINNKKLSNRWSQIFSQCVDTDAAPMPKSTTKDIDNDKEIQSFLREQMGGTIKQ